MNKPIALFDLDGTLCDYPRQLLRDLNALRHPDEKELTMEDLDPNNEPEYLHARRRAITYSQDWWENLQPYQPGISVLRIAQKIGFEIVILSQGPFDKTAAWTGKINWCKKYLPEVTSWTLTRDKSLVYGVVLVDDYPHYIKPWLDNRPRGLVVMPDHPWNEGFSHPNVIRMETNSGIIINYARVEDALKEAYERKAK